eukprot:6336073-Amphidinium_carterae.1
MMGGKGGTVSEKDCMQILRKKSRCLLDGPSTPLYPRDERQARRSWGATAITLSNLLQMV